ncbi:hypothetical protein TNCV_3663931 [Trichonephila clavipes]|nr:hypothetical protein TNCV_3663931 [Trichonephila clavipes]
MSGVFLQGGCCIPPAVLKTLYRFMDSWTRWGLVPPPPDSTKVPWKSLRDLRRDALAVMRKPLQKLYPLEMFVSDLPSDIALGENFPEPYKNSDRLKSPEVPGSSPPAPNPVAEVSRSMKQTRCSLRIVPRQYLNL